MIVWREKYRPNKIDDLAGCKDFKEAAKSWLAKGSLPANMLYVGPPGVGKTSAAYALAKELYGDYFDPSNFIVTNASDERGIDFVRELKHMAKQKGIGVRRRIFVLDEADSLTPAAQKALRQVMEDSHKTAIFILTANDISPIHKAIRDRCLTFRFKPLSDEEAKSKLTQIHLVENLPEPWLEQYTMLNRLTNGSLRQSIDILEGTPKTDDGLLQKLKRNTESLNKAALSFVGGDYQRLAEHMKTNLREGNSRVATLIGLRHRGRTLLEGGQDDWYAFMLTYGEFILLANMWPDDDDSFVDYFVAKLRKNKEEKI